MTRNPTLCAVAIFGLLAGCVCPFCRPGDCPEAPAPEDTRPDPERMTVEAAERALAEDARYFRLLRAGQSDLQVHPDLPATDVPEKLHAEPAE